MRAEVSTTREVSVLAEDPSVSVKSSGNDGSRIPLWSKVKIPEEPLEPGPRSSRFEVIDYDASRDAFYEPYCLRPGKCCYTSPSRVSLLNDDEEDEDETDIHKLLDDPKFHAHQVFAVASATLFEFERALGRNVSWGFRNSSHQLKLVPHAFNMPNAF